MTKPTMTADTINEALAEIRSRPQKVRGVLVGDTAAAAAHLTRLKDNLESITAADLTAAVAAHSLAQATLAEVDENLNYEETQAVQRHITANVTAITEVLFGKLKAVLAPEPTVRERIAAVAAGLTEKLRTAVGLDREIAAKEREAAESFAPAIAAYQEAARRLLGAFSAEPNFEHYGDACNKIEELKNLISEAAALKI